jgi:hypothetical protein
MTLRDPAERAGVYLALRDPKGRPHHIVLGWTRHLGRLSSKFDTQYPENEIKRFWPTRAQWPLGDARGVLEALPGTTHAGPEIRIQRLARAIGALDDWFYTSLGIEHDIMFG